MWRSHQVAWWEGAGEEGIHHSILSHEEPWHSVFLTRSIGMGCTKKHGFIFYIINPSHEIDKLDLNKSQGLRLFTKYSIFLSDEKCMSFKRCMHTTINQDTYNLQNNQHRRIQSFSWSWFLHIWSQNFPWAQESLLCWQESGISPCPEPIWSILPHTHLRSILTSYYLCLVVQIISYLQILHSPPPQCLLKMFQFACTAVLHPPLHNEWKVQWIFLPDGAHLFLYTLTSFVEPLTTVYHICLIHSTV